MSPRRAQWVWRCRQAISKARRACWQWYQSGPLKKYWQRRAISNRRFKSSPCPVSWQVESLQRLLPGKNIDSVFHDILAPILVHMFAPGNFSNPSWSWRVVETLHLITSEWKKGFVRLKYYHWFRSCRQRGIFFIGHLQWRRLTAKKGERLPLQFLNKVQLPGWRSLLLLKRDGEDLLLRGERWAGYCVRPKSLDRETWTAILIKHSRSKKWQREQTFWENSTRSGKVVLDKLWELRCFATNTFFLWTRQVFWSVCFETRFSPWPLVWKSVNRYHVKEESADNLHTCRNQIPF